MNDRPFHAVTGAFGYSGKYIATRLLERGRDVITLTNSTKRENPFEGRVRAFPFNFDKPDELARSLQGVSVLYNTYWVRFDQTGSEHEKAIRNSGTLFAAAREAGVERIVHVSITNPSEDSPLGYFRGKARVERLLAESGVSHAILRPAILFGKEDVLVNNIAFALRRLPIFGVFGMGDYRLQPIYVDDLAALAVEQGEKRENIIINAIGPETFTYRALVKAICSAIGKRRLIVPVPPTLGYLTGLVFGKLVGDIMLTLDEMRGLMTNQLCVDGPPVGTTRLTEWMREHAETLGRRYTSELARRVDRTRAYQSN